MSVLLRGWVDLPDLRKACCFPGVQLGLSEHGCPGWRSRSVGRRVVQLGHPDRISLGIVLFSNSGILLTYRTPPAVVTQFAD